MPLKQVVIVGIMVAVAVLSFCAEACPAPDAAAATCPAHHRSDCCDHQKTISDSISFAAATLTLPTVTEVLTAPVLMLIGFDLNAAVPSHFESPQSSRSSILRI